MQLFALPDHRIIMARSPAVAYFTCTHQTDKSLPYHGLESLHPRLAIQERRSACRKGASCSSCSMEHTVISNLHAYPS